MCEVIPERESTHQDGPEGSPPGLRRSRAVCWVEEVEDAIGSVNVAH